jgi:hypothetical protein
MRRVMGALLYSFLIPRRGFAAFRAESLRLSVQPHLKSFFLRLSLRKRIKQARRKGIAFPHGGWRSRSHPVATAGVSDVQ